MTGEGALLSRFSDLHILPYTHQHFQGGGEIGPGEDLTAAGRDHARGPRPCHQWGAAASLRRGPARAGLCYTLGVKMIEAVSLAG